jgi:DnaJ-class molecular chaperone
MAGEEGDSDDVDQAEASHEPRECMPCRGSGLVISNLGGTPNTVQCPWCGGSGLRLPDVDAQAKWLDGADATGSESA